MQEGVYVISVAARILDMHPQTLRKYERVGLVMPSRTEVVSHVKHRRRLYSDADIARLKLIKRLVDELGLNLAGVQLALAMFNRLIKMRQQLAHLEGQPLRAALNESLDEMFELVAG